MTMDSNWVYVEHDDPLIRIRTLNITDVGVVLFAQAFQNEYDIKPYSSYFSLLPKKSTLASDGKINKKVRLGRSKNVPIS